MADGQRIYWDDTVFTALLHGSGEPAATCRRLLDDAGHGKIQLVTSFLTIAEVFRFTGEPETSPLPLPPENGLRLTRFLENDFFLFVAVDRIVAERAQSLCRRHPLDPHRALHLACALRAGARQFHTCAGEPVTALSGLIGDPPLAIQPPAWSGQLSLLDSLFDVAVPAAELSR